MNLFHLECRPLCLVNVNNHVSLPTFMSFRTQGALGYPSPDKPTRPSGPLTPPKKIWILFK